MRLLVSFVLSFAYASQAAEFCATTSTELANHLTTAGSNNEDDVVRVATGTYASPNGGFFLSTIDDKNVSILGGWSPFFGNPCGQRLTSDPRDTVLDGGFNNPVFTVFPEPNSDFEFDLLTFRNGQSSQRGAGLRLATFTGYAGDVIISRNIFEDNRSESFGGGFSGGGGDPGRLVMRNNVFKLNTAVTDGAASITSNDEVLISNNTVAFNFANAQTRGSPGSGEGAFRVGNVLAPEKVRIVNNIFWGNQQTDLRLASGSFLLQNNLYGVLAGVAPTANSQGNIVGQDPLFDDGGFLQFGLKLTRESPAVDSGRQPFCVTVPLTAKGFTIPCDQWALETVDLAGLPRIIGPQVDMGAYENDVLFVDGFESQGFPL